MLVLTSGSHYHPNNSRQKVETALYDAEMNSMLDATEKSKPILQYVRELETKVRNLRAVQFRFDLKIFLYGVAAGAACSSALWYILR
jgi:hypothetical protein